MTSSAMKTLIAIIAIIVLAGVGIAATGAVIMFLGGLLSHAFGWPTALSFVDAALLGILISVVKAIFGVSVEKSL